MIRRVDRAGRLCVTNYWWERAGARNSCLCICRVSRVSRADSYVALGRTGHRGTCHRLGFPFPPAPPFETSVECVAYRARGFRLRALRCGGGVGYVAGGRGWCAEYISTYRVTWVRYAGSEITRRFRVRVSRLAIHGGAAGVGALCSRTGDACLPASSSCDTGRVYTVLLDRKPVDVLCACACVCVCAFDLDNAPTAASCAPKGREEPLRGCQQLLGRAGALASAESH